MTNINGVCRGTWNFKFPVHNGHKKNFQYKVVCFSADKIQFVCVLCHEICNTVYLKKHQNVFVGHALPDPAGGDYSLSKL